MASEKSRLAKGLFIFQFWYDLYNLINTDRTVDVNRPDPDRIRGLTLGTIDRAAVRASWSTLDVVATAFVLLLVAGLLPGAAA